MAYIARIRPIKKTTQTSCKAAISTKNSHLSCAKAGIYMIIESQKQENIIILDQHDQLLFHCLNLHKVLYLIFFNLTEDDRAAKSARLDEESEEKKEHKKLVGDTDYEAWKKKILDKAAKSKS